MSCTVKGLSSVGSGRKGQEERSEIVIRQELVLKIHKQHVQFENQVTDNLIKIIKSLARRLSKEHTEHRVTVQCFHCVNLSHRRCPLTPASLVHLHSVGGLLGDCWVLACGSYESV